MVGTNFHQSEPVISRTFYMLGINIGLYMQQKKIKMQKETSNGKKSRNRYYKS